jgi:hypothetical protein
MFPLYGMRAFRAAIYHRKGEPMPEQQEIQRYYPPLVNRKVLEQALRKPDYLRALRLSRLQYEALRRR